MNAKNHLPRIIALAALVVMAMLAGVSARAQQPPSAVFRPALLESSAGNYSYSTRADLDHGGVVGGVAVHHLEISLSGRHGLSPGLQLAYGFGYDTNLLDADAAVPLPEQLSVFSLNVGLIRTVNSAWTAALFARPGFYGDFAHLGSRSLNLPVLLTANYSPGPDLTWIFALRYDPFSKNPVLPVIGVRWLFAPGWEFDLGFPRTGITRQLGGGLALRGDASFQGGSYRVTAAPPALPGLDGSLLDYREIRLGAGLDWKPAAATRLSLDAGFVADRRFDYHGRGYKLDGDPAGFLRLAFSARF